MGMGTGPVFFFLYPLLVDRPTKRKLTMQIYKGSSQDGDTNTGYACALYHDEQLHDDVLTPVRDG